MIPREGFLGERPWLLWGTEGAAGTFFPGCLSIWRELAPTSKFIMTAIPTMNIIGFFVYELTAHNT